LDTNMHNLLIEMIIFEQGLSLTETPEFKRWFGDSKVVDSKGDPLVVYHGSRIGGIADFKKSYARKGVVGSNSSEGFYFTDSEDAAAFFADPTVVYRDSSLELSVDDIFTYGEMSEWYALLGDEINIGPFSTEQAAEDAAVEIVNKWDQARDGDEVHRDDKILKVYLSLKNPKIVDDMGAFRKAERTAEADGYDGIIARDIHDGMEISTVYVAFNPAQIKSATGNKGTFNPDSVKINEKVLNLEDLVRTTDWRYVGLIDPKGELLSMRTYTGAKMNHSELVTGGVKELKKKVFGKGYIRVNHTFGVIHAEKEPTQEQYIKLREYLVDLHGEHKDLILHSKKKEPMWREYESDVAPAMIINTIKKYYEN